MRPIRFLSTFFTAGKATKFFQAEILKYSNREMGTFGKRFAVKIGEFERSIINTSLTKDEIKAAFKMMDENNG